MKTTSILPFALLCLVIIPTFTGADQPTNYLHQLPFGIVESDSFTLIQTAEKQFFAFEDGSFSSYQVLNDTCNQIATNDANTPFCFADQDSIWMLDSTKNFTVSEVYQPGNDFDCSSQGHSVKFAYEKGIMVYFCIPQDSDDYVLADVFITFHNPQKFFDSFSIDYEIRGFGIGDDNLYVIVRDDHGVTTFGNYNYMTGNFYNRTLIGDNNYSRQFQMSNGAEVAILSTFDSVQTIYKKATQLGPIRKGVYESAVFEDDIILTLEGNSSVQTTLKRNHVNEENGELVTDNTLDLYEFCSENKFIGILRVMVNGFVVVFVQPNSQGTLLIYIDIKSGLDIVEVKPLYSGALMPPFKFNNGSTIQITTNGYAIYSDNNDEHISDLKSDFGFFKGFVNSQAIANYSVPTEPGVFYTFYNQPQNGNSCYLTKYNATDSSIKRADIENCPDGSIGGYTQILSVYHDESTDKFDMIFEQYPRLYQVSQNKVTFTFPDSYFGYQLTSVYLNQLDEIVLFGKEAKSQGEESAASMLQIYVLNANDGTQKQKLSVPALNIKKVGDSTVQLLVSAIGSSVVQTYDASSLKIVNSLTITNFTATDAVPVQGLGFVLIDSNYNIIFSNLKGEWTKIQYSNYGKSSLSGHIFSDKGFVLNSWNDGFGKSGFQSITFEEEQEEKVSYLKFLE